MARRDVRLDGDVVVLLDQAGWHLSAKLTVPKNITLLPASKVPRAQPGREHLAVHP
jgi:hypothetical protein